MRDRGIDYEASRIDHADPGEGLTPAAIAVVCCLGVIAGLLYLFT